MSRPQVRLSGDDFVDVHLYSAPVVVGTFPVVAGAIEIPLSSALLSSVSAGPHTLVLVGTTSGKPCGVALSVVNSLSATGFETSLSLIGLSGAHLLAGAAALLWRRRAAVSI